VNVRLNIVPKADISEDTERKDEEKHPEKVATVDMKLTIQELLDEALSVLQEFIRLRQENPNVLRKHSRDLRKTTLKELIDDAVQTLSNNMRNVPREHLDGTEGIKLENICKLISLLENFGRKVINVRNGSILLTITCETIAALWDLKVECRSQRLLAVCRAALIPLARADMFDVTIEIKQTDFENCRKFIHNWDPPSRLNRVNLETFLHEIFIHE